MHEHFISISSMTMDLGGDFAWFLISAPHDLTKSAIVSTSENVYIYMQRITLLQYLKDMHNFNYFT